MSGTDGDFLPPGPPWTFEVIADLHAGVYPATVDAELRRRMADDQDAQAMLTALGGAVDDLSLLPPLQMPDRYSRRLDAAIAAEAAARSLPAQRLGPAVHPVTPPSQRVAPPPLIRTELAQMRLSPAANPSAPGQLPQIPGMIPPHHQAPQHYPAAAGWMPPPRLEPQGRAERPAEALLPSRLHDQAVVDSGSSGTPPEASTSNVRSLDKARERRRRVITGLGIAAAVVVLGGVGVAVAGHHNGGSGGLAVAAHPGGPTVSPGAPGLGGSAFTIDPNNLGGALKQLDGKTSTALSDPLTFASCLAANNVSGKTVLGTADVTVPAASGSSGTGATGSTSAGSPQEIPAVAIAVAIDATHAEVLVVGPTCGPAGAQLLTSKIVDR